MAYSRRSCCLPLRRKAGTEKTTLGFAGGFFAIAKQECRARICGKRRIGGEIASPCIAGTPPRSLRGIPKPVRHARDLFRLRCPCASEPGRLRNVGPRRE